MLLHEHERLSRLGRSRKLHTTNTVLAMGRRSTRDWRVRLRRGIARRAKRCAELDVLFLTALRSLVKLPG